MLGQIRTNNKRICMWKKEEFKVGQDYSFYNDRGTSEPYLRIDEVQPCRRLVVLILMGMVLR